MKALITKTLSRNTFLKKPSDVGQPTLQRFTYNQTVTTLSALFLQHVYTITANTYNDGYFILPYPASRNEDIFILVGGGPVLINKTNSASDIVEYHYTVFDNQYIVFRNNVTVNGHTVTDLAEALHENDKLIVYYLYQHNNNVLNTYAIRLNDSIYNNGYFQLKQSTNKIIAVVSAGPFLTQNVHYKIVDDYFVFKNNVVINGQTVTSITETLQEFDILVLIEFYA